MTTKKAKAKKSVAKKSPAKKKAATKKNGNGHVGVIDAIVQIMSRETGASAAEILAALKKKFPDRTPMIGTVRTQVHRHSTKKARDEKRGMVYFGNGQRHGS